MLDFLQHEVICVELANLAVESIVYGLQLQGNNRRVEQGFQGTDADCVILFEKPIDSISFPVPCYSIR